MALMEASGACWYIRTPLLYSGLIYIAVVKSIDYFRCQTFNVGDKGGVKGPLLGTTPLLYFYVG